MQNEYNREYAGFWVRVWALAVDIALLYQLISTLSLIVFGSWSGVYSADTSGFWLEQINGFLIAYAVPTIVVILFWYYCQATPGKMLFGLSIVDANTGEPPTLSQCTRRFFLYLLSIAAFGLGFFWVAFDARKQGWHDKVAGTLVIRSTLRVNFANTTTKRT